MRSVLFLILIGFLALARAQEFRSIPTQLDRTATGWRPAHEWSPKGKDGKPILYYADYSSPCGAFKFSNGAFVRLDGALRRGAGAWGDFDRDGEPDLAVAADSGTRVYRNQGGSFVDAGFNLPSARSADWGDFNLDGYPDLLLTGGPKTVVCLNAMGIVTASTIILDSANSGRWGAVENGYRFVLLSKSNQTWSVAYSSGSNMFTTLKIIASTGGRIEMVNVKGGAWPDLAVYDNNAMACYANNGGTSWPLLLTVPGAYEASWSTWVDIDGNGFADFALGHGYYPNSGGQFGAKVVLPFAAAGYAGGINRFGDFDGDGDADAVQLYESEPYFAACKYWRNDQGSWVAMPTPIQPLSRGSLEIADIDGDRDLDLVLNGMIQNNSYGSQALLNVGGGFKPGYTIPASRCAGYPADYDSDGDLDILLLGKDRGEMKLLRNSGAGEFQPEANSFPRLDGTAAWADFDRDGMPDLATTGYDGAKFVSGLYKQGPPGKFSLSTDTILRASNSSLTFSDPDNDGDLDLLASGATSLNYWGDGATEFSRNAGDTFRLQPHPFGSMFNTVADWGDFDIDFDLDLILCGNTGSLNEQRCTLYRNDNGELRPTEESFPGVAGGSVHWGDYDVDGRLDLLAVGDSAFTPEIPPTPNRRIFRNMGSGFVLAWAEFDNTASSYKGRADWIDYDNDGDLDAAFSSPSSTWILRNDLGRFVDPGLRLNGRAAAWFDANGDGRIDLAMHTNEYHPTVPDTGTLRIFLNGIQSVNTRPSAPAGLRSTLEKSAATLAWTPASDGQTPTKGLRYSVRIGTSPGASDVMAASALADGRLTLLKPNAGPAPGWRITGLAPGTYYWSVQSIDGFPSGSPFAPEASFKLGTETPQLIAAEPGKSSVRVVWRQIPDQGRNFARYYIYAGPVGGALALRDSTGTLNDTVKTLALGPDSAYAVRVSAVDLGRNESPLSDQMHVVTDNQPPPVPQALAAEAGDRSITLVWNRVQDTSFAYYLIYQKTGTGAYLPIDTAAGDTQRVVSDLPNGLAATFAIAAVDRIGNESTRSADVSAIPRYLVSIRPEAVDFGSIGLKGFRDTVAYVENAADLPVTVDSIGFAAPGYSAVSELRILPARSTVPFVIRFASPDPDGGRFSGAVRIHYGGRFAEIGLSGTAVGSPVCALGAIQPAALAWDTAGVVRLQATAHDSDKAGTGDPIRAYLWESSLDGPLPGRAGNLDLRSSDFSIGTHAIRVRAVDNEGDTSDFASASLQIRNRKPHLAIESIHPAGIVLQGGEDVRIRGTGYDQDQFADDAHDSLAYFGLHSTLQGLIGRSKDTTFPSSVLKLGLHGLYLKGVDNEGDTAHSDTVWIPVQPGIGHAMVVAGTAFNDFTYFFVNIAPNTNWAVGRLLQRGFTREQIHYLNPVGWQGLSNPYVNSHIVDETDVNLQSLKARLLALKPDVEKGVPLFISLVGHGQATQQRGKFFLSQQDALLPDSLHAWLGEFRTDPAGTNPIVILLDFCYSGSFIRRLISDSQERLIIASSTADRQAYFQGGRGFSYVFFNAVQAGKSVADAFLAARDWSDANAPSAESKAVPQLSGNADILFNQEEDFRLARRTYIGGTRQFQSVGSEWASLDIEQIALDRIRIKARHRGGAAPDTAWYALLALDDGDSLARNLPWRGGRMVLDEDGGYSAEAAIPAEARSALLATVFGQVGTESMMPLSREARLEAEVGLAGLDGLEGFALGRNSPNPFTHSTRFLYRTTAQGWVEMSLLDLQGRSVKRWWDVSVAAGLHAREWDGQDASGRTAPAGVYLVRLRTPEGVLTRPIFKQR